MRGEQFSAAYTLASPGAPLNASSGNVAAAVASATLTPGAYSTGPGGPTPTAYLTGFELTGAGATAASVIVGTVTGVVSGPLSYVVAIPAGAAVGVQPLAVEFTQPLAASAPGVAIVVSFPSFGAGNTNACVNAHGFWV